MPDGLALEAQCVLLLEPELGGVSGEPGGRLPGSFRGPLLPPPFSHKPQPLVHVAECHLSNQSSFGAAVCASTSQACEQIPQLHFK